MDFLFGAETLWVRFFFAFIIVLGLIGATAFLVRRFGAGGVGSSSSRGRQPRLAVIDAAAVDGRRRLILIRRDNVEHLLMIGGPSDVVVEANIVRAAQGARDAAGSRPAQPEALPRAAPSNEGNMWPLQPEPAAAPPPVPMRAPPRPQPAAMEEPPPWHHEPEAPPLPPRRAELRPEPRAEVRPEPRMAEPRMDVRPEPRQESRPEPRPVDPLAGLAAELSRVQPEPPAPKPRPQRDREVARARPPQPERVRPAPPPSPAMDETTAAGADQNLAEMAQRLEAALRRPKAPEPRGPEAPPKQPMMNAAAPEPMIPMAEPAPFPTAETAMPHDEPPPAPQPAPARAAAAKPAPQKSVYDSLEQEMASLLGRPNSKT